MQRRRRRRRRRCLSLPPLHAFLVTVTRAGCARPTQTVSAILLSLSLSLSLALLFTSLDTGLIIIKLLYRFACRPLRLRTTHIPAGAPSLSLALSLSRARAVSVAAGDESSFSFFFFSSFYPKSNAFYPKRFPNDISVMILIAPVEARDRIDSFVCLFYNERCLLMPTIGSYCLYS